MGRLSYAGFFSISVCAGIAFGFSPSPSNPAQNSAARTAAPHVAALRQQLGLSPNLRLEWIASNNGTDTMRVVDDFNRVSIGNDWALDDRYWIIKDGELVLTSAAIYEWRYLAVFKPVYNIPDRQIHSVSYRWGQNADAVGIGEGAHALMITAPAYDASGYWCWRRTNQNSVWLYAIKDGAWEYTPGESKEYNRSGSRLPIPQGGDYIEVVISNQPEAVYFDYFINGRFDATVYDGSKEFAQSPTWYAGVFIHGQDLNNQVDDFTITWLGQDGTPPAPITDLRALDSTSTSVTLEWTSPGDNYYDGSADRLVVRYSTNPITARNFSSATLAQDIPAPAGGGASQQFVIQGLAPNTQYYFAMRAFDEVNNSSGLSNVVTTRTRRSGVAQSIQMISDCEQTGAVGTAFPLSVKVIDQDGFGVAGYLVDFVITLSDGSLGGKQESSLVTDASGVATVAWGLGTKIGENRVEIIATGLQGSPLRCSMTAVAGPAQQFVNVNGTSHLLSPNKVSEPLVIQLADDYGNGIADASVTFSITSGDGTFVNATSSNGRRLRIRTDGEGKAGAQVQAGEDYGDSTAISVSLDNNDEVPAAQLSVKTTEPQTISMVSGDQQTGPLGLPLPQPLVVKITDQLGAPVPDYSVSFQIVGGNGSLQSGGTSEEIATDSTGRASTSWIIGLGVNTLEVSAEDLQGSPVEFTATGVDSANAVGERNGAPPRQFALLPNAPNPFNPSTTIHFELPQTAEVAIEIFDLSGRQIRRLFEGALGPGLHHLVWDGKDERNRALDSGVYFCRLRARMIGLNEMHVATRKLTLAK
jgi:flagellar hook assembly protein FlgD